MAARYRCEYVDLRAASIDHDLFRSIPVDLMFRYNFVPMKAQNGTLDIALSDPQNLNLIDEPTLLLNKKLRVATLTRSFLFSSRVSSSMRFRFRSSALKMVVSTSLMTGAISLSVAVSLSM